MQAALAAAATKMLCPTVIAPTRKRRHMVLNAAMSATMFLCWTSRERSLAPYHEHSVFARVSHRQSNTLTHLDSRDLIRQCATAE